jgi:hypothetical protein
LATSPTFHVAPASSLRHTRFAFTLGA